MKNSLGLFQPAKGVLVLLVIFAHTIQTLGGVSWILSHPNPLVGLLGIFLRIFYYFVIPCFYMICGYGFRKRPLHIFAKNQLLPMGRAYLITMAIILPLITLRALFEGWNVPQTIIPQCMSYLLMNIPAANYFGYELPDIGMMWFVCTLAVASVVLNQVLTLKNRRSQIAVCILLVCTGVLLRNIHLPFCIHQALICCSFMYTGYMMRQEKLLTQKLPWYLPALALVFCLLIPSNSEYIFSVASNTYPNGLLDLAAAWVIGYVMMFFFVHLNEMNGIIIDALSWIGQYSFVVFCTHYVERKSIPWDQAALLGIQSVPLRCAVGFILRTLFCLTVAYAIVLWKEKRRLRHISTID